MLEILFLLELIESPYEGPFEVLDCTDKVVKIKLPNGDTSTVSADRIKMLRIKKNVNNRSSDAPTITLMILKTRRCKKSKLSKGVKKRRNVLLLPANFSSFCVFSSVLVFCMRLRRLRRDYCSAHTHTKW